jgi:hypothetical protein
MWWHIPVILALGRLRWEDWELEANLGYTMNPYSNNTNKDNTP